MYMYISVFKESLDISVFNDFSLQTIERSNLKSNIGGRNKTTTKHTAKLS